jgi:hypothetical protein
LRAVPTPRSRRDREEREEKGKREQCTTRNGVEQSVADLGVPVLRGDEDYVARVLPHLADLDGSVSGAGVTDRFSQIIDEFKTPTARPRRASVWSADGHATGRSASTSCATATGCPAQAEPISPIVVGALQAVGLGSKRTRLQTVAS